MRPAHAPVTTLKAKLCQRKDSERTYHYANRDVLVAYIPLPTSKLQSLINAM
jgi:hypothetical protein